MLKNYLNCISNKRSGKMGSTTVTYSAARNTRSFMNQGNNVKYILEQGCPISKCRAAPR